MRNLIVLVVAWAFLLGSSVWSMAEEGPNSGPEAMQQLEISTNEDKQETTLEQVQSPSDGKLTKEQLRAVIRAKRERLRGEMKIRRDTLRTEGEAIQREIMAKKARHIHPKGAAEVIVVHPAN